MIINLTQHNATAEQIAAGVAEPKSDEKQLICKLLTFENIPSATEMDEVADCLASIAMRYIGQGCTAAMIGGAPFFMRSLEEALKMVKITPVYAFSRRESVDFTNEDGSVTKRAVFRHLGFVEVF